MTLSIEPLGCGTLTGSRSFFEDGASADPIALPVPAWLIRHPHGLVLFDTGLHEDLTNETPYRDEVSQFFEIGCTSADLIAARLAAAEVDPSDIAVVVLSHLHFDHTGGLAQIPDARVVVQGAEWTAGFTEELAAANAFRPGDYDLGHELVEVDGEHDVFDDGTIICLPTPGHTPGHQSLLVRLADRDVVLCADCAYFESTLAGGPLPPFGYDTEQQAASIKGLRQRRKDGALVIPGHDPVTMRTLPDVLT